ncbi:Nuclear RNA export factor 1 [Acropora cervicornis]|uniref:Nuclear RNA export factor 1 n=1 Tax=Acropora cervicornis TaxID=6130 RepID=A0AAD9PUQ3_ACRCE|nr:Nuclear RNA export factor 1 [Acropora cervicornis]
MCVHFGTMSKDRSAPRGPSLGEYLKNSRNMMRVTEPERRVGLLKHSRLSVVAFLNELPATKHDWSTFTVDRFANETSASSTEKVSAEVSPVSCTPQQQEMLLKFSQQSTMNLEWSFKCLKENNWDYGKAAHAFTSLKSNGSIPPQAFIKSS